MNTTERFRTDLKLPEKHVERFLFFFIQCILLFYTRTLNFRNLRYGKNVSSLEIFDTKDNNIVYTGQ